MGGYLTETLSAVRFMTGAELSDRFTYKLDGINEALLIKYMEKIPIKVFTLKQHL